MNILINLLIKVCCLISILIINGCITPTLNGHAVSKAPHQQFVEEQKYDVIKNYKIGVPNSTAIGQSMIRIIDYNYIKETRNYKTFNNSKDYMLKLTFKDKEFIKISIKADRVVNIPLNNNDYSIIASTYIDGDRYFIVPVKDTEGFVWGLLINKQGTINSNYLADNNFDKFHYVTSMDHSGDSSMRMKSASDEPKIRNITKGKLNYEIIYSGMSKVAMNFTYREYTNDDLARTAFFQNLSYEPGTKQIRFKDFVITLNSIDNEQVDFTINEDGFPSADGNDHNYLLKLVK